MNEREWGEQSWFAKFRKTIRALREMLRNIMNHSIEKEGNHFFIVFFF
jgi:hypothetical protein